MATQYQIEAESTTANAAGIAEVVSLRNCLIPNIKKICRRFSSIRHVTFTLKILLRDFRSGGEASMPGFLERLFNEQTLSPHGICLLWRPELIWLHVGSDALIALAYFSIPFALAVFVSKRPDVKYGWVVRPFGLDVRFSRDISLLRYSGLF